MIGSQECILKKLESEQNNFDSTEFESVFRTMAVIYFLGLTVSRNVFTQQQIRLNIYKILTGRTVACSVQDIERIMHELYKPSYRSLVLALHNVNNFLLVVKSCKKYLCTQTWIRHLATKLFRRLLHDM